MRTSLNNIRETEKYLLGVMTPVEQLIFNARMLINPLLRRDAHFQQKAYRIIQHYGRKRLREEIVAVENRIFNDRDARSFQDRVSKIFNKQ